MKKSILLLMIMQSVAIAVCAQNTNFGVSSGTLGVNNSFFGYFTGNAAQATSRDNSFFGKQAGKSLTTAIRNSAFGSEALFSNTTSHDNSAFGYRTLYLNTTGHNNTAVGLHVLYNNTSGHFNTASGRQALISNTAGSYNTAHGNDVLFNNTTGEANTATGSAAMTGNTSGGYNAGFGFYALFHNKTGSNNAAFGYFAGPGSTLINLNNTTAIGSGAITTASNQVRIGNSAVTSIGGQVSWTTLSDGRFKRDLKEDVSGLDFINQLRPVSYIVDKNAVDKFLGIPDSLKQQLPQAKSIPARQTGFVAQEVEAIIKKSGYVFSGVESPQNDNDHYSIRYAEFVVPLVKAMQELTAIMKEQEKKSEEQQLEIVELKQKLGIYEKSTKSDIHTKVILFQNNPNPFTGDTEIKMALPETARQVNLIVYNLEGKQLKDVVVNERGNAKATISASELSAGMYLYALIVDGEVVDTKRLVLTK